MKIFQDFLSKLDSTEKHESNFGNLCMKKGGSFQKERFSFLLKSSMGGGVTPKSPRAYATGPTYHNGKRICRPLIVKIATKLDKNKIFGHVKNLKSFYEIKESTLLHDKYIYVSNHLPKEFVPKRKRLYP